MKAILLTLALALLMVGCGEADLSDPDVIEDTAADAVDWSKLQDRDGVTYLPNTDKPFSGYAKRAYENEQVEILAQFKDGYVVRVKQWQENGVSRWDVGLMEGKVGIKGMPWKSRPTIKEVGHGPATVWHENGQKKEEGNFKDGKRDGPATRWYENGQKMYEVNFKDDKQDGLETSWYEGGQKRGKKNYKDGKKDGLYTSWYKNGQKLGEGNWKDGKVHGLATKWYDNGQKLGEGNWKDGKLMSAVVWKFNGEKCPFTNVKNGNGSWVVYNEDGTERYRETYKDGERVYEPGQKRWQYLSPGATNVD